MSIQIDHGIIRDLTDFSRVIGGVGNDTEAFRHSIGSEGVKAVEQMGIECVEIIRERVEKYAIDCDLKWGYCDVALKPRHLKGFEEYMQHLRDIGFNHEMRMLSREDTRQYVNSDIYLGGCYNEGWGHVHPLNLCLGEVRAAESLGAKIFEHSRVTSITYGDNPAVHTDKGRVNADYVVLCGNAYMEDLVPKLSARVLPSTSCIIATEPLTEQQLEQSMRQDVAVCDARTALDYYRLSADKRLLFGGLSNYTSLEPANIIDIMRKKMCHVFPALGDVKIDYKWSGQMGICVRRMPLMGRLDGNVLPD
ncbi:MAG: FAD-binding oxidoreductase [Halieaceae bacterium]|nr:FAD-binding oxidoreductase [Halieaceae bacterium]